MPLICLAVLVAEGPAQAQNPVSTVGPTQDAPPAAPAPQPPEQQVPIPMQQPAATPAPTPAPTPAATPPTTYVLVPIPLSQSAVPAQPPAPPSTQAEPEAERRTLRRFVFGVGPLVLANVHWLDKPGIRKVSVNGLRGEDRQYPGFYGADAGFGLMLDLRYRELIGLELDLIYQDDHGTGTVKIRDRGDLCYIPTSKVSYRTSEHKITIGQRAWHVPLLAKLSLPRSEETVVINNHRQVIIKSSTTLAFGPEFVFPEDAELEIAPDGLGSPRSATASTYVMYTAALGFELRFTHRLDLRLFGSVRGSFNPEPKNSVMRRATHEAERGELVASTYRSEWRWQLATNLGLGWFF